MASNGSAVSVYSTGGHRLGDAGSQTDHPGEVGFLCRLANTTHDDLVDSGRIDSGTGGECLTTAVPDRRHLTGKLSPALVKGVHRPQ